VRVDFGSSRRIVRDGAEPTPAPGPTVHSTKTVIEIRSDDEL
jgi:hypothetical protein